MATDIATITKRMIADLEKSGIPKDKVLPLGLQVLTAQQTIAYMKSQGGVTFDVPTYEIPYFNSHGVRTGYSRLKNLDVKKKFGRATKSHKSKQAFKYLQKANTAPHLYIPPVYDWPRNEDDKIVVDKLVITEGEKKAIKACLCGIPCVALGGVDSFKSAKRGIFLLEEFDDFDLESTDIEICYDSDLNTNEMVRKAMHQLANEIATRNPASIGYVMLDGESTGNGKLGLDDFLNEYQEGHEKRAFDKLPRKVDRRQDVMTIFDNELCYLESASKLYNIQGDRYYDSNAALVTDYGPKYKIADPDDTRKKIAAIKVWLEDRGDNTWCEKLVYEPGKSRRYKPEGSKLDCINLWKPSAVKPIKGDVDLWLQLVKYVMVTPKNYEWFMQWLAYPLQKPGTKLLQGVFVYSRTQGVGKNFIIEPLLREIYGKQYSLIVSSQLDSDYNGWVKCKQFIFAEEIWMSDKRDRETTMGRLKSQISNEFVVVNEKYRPEESFKNYAQLYMTANQSNALALEADDRRVFVVHAPEQQLAEDFYEELDAWCKQPDSAGKVLNHLLHEVDISKFNPRANAPFTDDKDEIIEQTRDMVQSYIATLASRPRVIYDNNGVMPEQQLYSTDEVFRAINTYARTNNMPELRITHDSLGKYLGNTNQFPHRRVNLNSKGYKRTLYAIFHKKTWKKTEDRKWTQHYKFYSPEYRERIKSKIEGKPREKADVIDIATRAKLS